MGGMYYNMIYKLVDIIRYRTVTDYLPSSSSENVVMCYIQV